MVLAYILLVLFAQPAGNNGRLREVQNRSCKRLLTRCTARPGMLCDHTHPCFVCVCFIYHSYDMLWQLVAGLSSRRIWVQSNCSRSGICGGQSGTGM